VEVFSKALFKKRLFPKTTRKRSTLIVTIFT